MFALSAISSVAAGIQTQAPVRSVVPSPAYQEKRDEATQVEAFGIVQRMAECIVRVDRKASKALLLTDPATPTGYEALNRLKPFMPDCLLTAAGGPGGYVALKASMDTLVLRGAISATFYRREFLNRLPASLPTPAGVEPIVSPRNRDPSVAEWVSSAAFAQCLTAAQPTIVRQIVLSDVGSTEEADGLSKLSPLMKPCTFNGMTFKTDRNSLRFMLADALYRWTVTAQGAR